ncbi:MAG: Gfo/Idh/MocA family oxidoreductase [Chloroflexi bacterium]|nr:Gfo/Idh/MocA family oxidoreductase [Chloroflexota bacterium]
MIRAGVIGLGAMGANHARVYANLPGVQLAAVADPRPEALEAATHNRTARPYHDYRAMLAHESLDVCSVVVPTTLHYEVGRDVLQQGVHLLLEKPIAATVEESQALLSAAEDAAVKLMVGHIERFNPAVQALLARVRSGTLGKLYQVQARRLGPLPPRIKDVGVAVDLATHDLDLLRLLVAPAQLESVYAVAITPFPAVYEEHVTALLRYSDDITGLLEVSWLTPMKVRELWVYGERGTYRADLLSQDLYYFENALAAPGGSAAHAIGEGNMTKVWLQREEPLVAEIRAFLRAVQEDSPVPVSAADGLWALAVARRVQEAAACGMPLPYPELPLEAQG